MILLIDNYDSFVHNLARYLRRLGQETLVVRNDLVTEADTQDRNDTVKSPHRVQTAARLLRCQRAR